MSVFDRAVVTYPGPAFCLNDRAAGAEYGSGDATAMFQAGIGGIDNRVHRLLGEISLKQFKTLPIITNKTAHFTILLIESGENGRLKSYHVSGVIIWRRLWQAAFKKELPG
jgi:hypothetical protein